jgi:4-hydroxy-2-oxoheptanedioate aldolase
MLPESLRARAAANDVALGGWLFLREPLAAEVASRAGYDYVCIDAQHGLQSYDTISALLSAAAGGSSLPVVRVPWNEAGFIGRVLDAGALGIIIPMVNTADEARAAVAACRYPPLGTRSLGPVGAGARYGSDYFAGANAAVSVIPMIETEQAVANVEEIVAVPGVDAVYVGPSDLSVSLGLGPGMDQEDRRFVDALERTVAACERAGVIPGIHANVDLVEKRRGQGFRMITVGFDMHPMIAGLNGAVADARRRLASTRSS